MNAVQKAFYNGEDYGNCYLFSPSISRRKTWAGKPIMSAGISAAAMISKRR